MSKNLSPIETARRLDYITGLRQLADFIEAHPTCPVPYGEAHNTFVASKADLVALARIPGVSWVKHVAGDYFALRVPFAGDHFYDVNIQRDQICKKVVIGTKQVPAREAVPAHEVEDVQWVCEDSLLKETV